jgi:hypothetical protein
MDRPVDELFFAGARLSTLEMAKATESGWRLPGIPIADFNVV